MKTEINNDNVKKLSIWTGVGFLSLAIISYVLFSHPSEFPARHVITIEKGMGLASVSSRLYTANIIRFPSIFKTLVFFTSGEGSIKAGNYFFEKPLSLVGVYLRITRGVYGVKPITVTIFEGWTVEQIGERLEKLGFFNKEEWLLNAKNYEGYLFPDTYFFQPDDISLAVVLGVFRDNFEKKVNAVFSREIIKQEKKRKDIIVMASLIEKEAGSFEDARMISGILWKRLKQDMKLQVDATLTYITGKPSLKLTEKDLAIDSPYNTYKYRGLPPGPIANPGLDAIRAALYPQESPYLFYLHDKKRNPHYAETFKEHKENKVKYLR